MATIFHINTFRLTSKWQTRLNKMEHVLTNFEIFSDHTGNLSRNNSFYLTNLKTNNSSQLKFLVISGKFSKTAYRKEKGLHKFIVLHQSQQTWNKYTWKINYLGHKSNTFNVLVYFMYSTRYFYSLAVVALMPLVTGF